MGFPFSTQLWTPPTPPQDDNDIYIDSVMCLMYETTPIPESKLPPVYVRKERRRHKTDPSGVHLVPVALSHGYAHVFCCFVFVSSEEPLCLQPQLAVKAREVGLSLSHAFQGSLVTASEVALAPLVPFPSLAKVEFSC